ncbi:hypothetical protein HYE82_04675 [Streptomyces sp. BR123]|uniref:hypothetical protein n=1 Tax=Streptomyces sp. BR123 TaxID=2749828 RepID=UPI0015C4C153|nr:hypothetical protein [Streptomyces sp. BR123]NXY93706.1 hypothetical protein [Streptomyces sp. BR123]
MVIDVVGYYGVGSKAAFATWRRGLPAEGGPVRHIDSRSLPPNTWPCLAGGYYALHLNSPNRDALPIEAHVTNLTVTTTTGAGHLSVAPDPNSARAYQYGYGSNRLAPPPPR